MPRLTRDRGDDLDGARTGTDDGDDLVGKLGKCRIFRRTPGVAIVPARGVEDFAGEGLNPLDGGGDRRTETTVGADNHAGPDGVATVGRNRPDLVCVVPHRAGCTGVEDGPVVEAEEAGHVLAVVEGLVRHGEPTRRHIARLLQQRVVDVRFHVALRARVAVPVPGSAEVPRLVHDEEVLQARLTQLRAERQPREACADDEDVHLAVERLARRGRRPRVVILQRVRALRGGGARALEVFLAVAAAECIRGKLEVNLHARVRELVLQWSPFKPGA